MSTVQDSPSCDSRLNYTNYVWAYYAGNLPPILSAFLSHSYQALGERWRLMYLTNQNISQYVFPEDLPSNYELYTAQAQSDLLRLVLLERYGGWWLDLTTIVNTDAFMLDAQQKLHEECGQFFGYCFHQCPTGLIESNVLYAPTNSSLIHAWKLEYTKALLQGREKYIFGMLRDGVDLPQPLFSPYPKSIPYFTIYAAERVAITRTMPRHTPFSTLNAEEHIYKLMADCGFHKYCIWKNLRVEMEKQNYPITKIWSEYRKLVWPGAQAKSRTTGKEPHFSARKKDPNTQYGIPFSLLLTFLLLCLRAASLCFFLHGFTNSLLGSNTLHYKE